MTRGKYAAKAAGQRAAAAAETVETLKAQLAEDRANAAREIAELKTENQRLAGQLTRDVNRLAKAEVERARAEARDLIQAERDEQHVRNAEAVHYLARLNLNIAHEDMLRLCELLGVDPGEVARDYEGVPRAARRVSNSRARKALSMLEQGYQPTGVARPW